MEELRTKMKKVFQDENRIISMEDRNDIKVIEEALNRLSTRKYASKQNPIPNSTQKIKEQRRFL